MNDVTDLDFEVAEALGWVDLAVEASGQGGVCLYGLLPGVFPKRMSVPAFTYDANAVLPLKDTDVLYIIVTGNGVLAQLNKNEKQFGETLAEARARAWLSGVPRPAPEEGT